MSHSQPDLPFHRSIQRLHMTFWRRRFLYWLVRAIWLALLVPVIILAGYLLQGWQISSQILIFGMLIIGGLVIAWAIRPIGLQKMVQRLDQRLDLQARLVTALEVTQTKKPELEAENNPVSAYLLQEAVQIVTNVRSQVRLLNRIFWLEIRTLVGVVTLLMALLMFNVLSSPRLPNAAPESLPETWQEPSGGGASQDSADLEEATPYDPATQKESEMDQSQIRSALEIIADALRDQATSRPVSEAIDEGDYYEAAESLRRLADQLNDISSNSRQELGGSLQQAADEIGDSGPEFTVPLEAGSEALAEDDIVGGGQALEDLAEVIESLAETSQEPTETNEMEKQEEPSETEQVEPEDGEAQQAEEEPPPPPEESEEESEEPPPPPQEESDEEQEPHDEEPLEIESDFELEDRTLEKAELDAEAGENLTQDSPFARQPLDSPGDLGPDPLTYPWEKREVIRDYFTP